MRKRCYYQVLEVNLKATLSQIRHSYHKLAMKWHPDKNKSEEAKIKFQEINEAYSILSDPSEKTWYDRHRETIIKNWNAGNPDPATSGEGNALMNTSAGTYWPYFMRPVYLGYDDTESGFYTVYRQVFKALKNGVEEMNELVNELEEDEHEDYETNMLIVRAPSFGDSETRLGKVGQFYCYWENMIPFIEASWENLHHLESIRNSNISIEELKWREKLVKKFIEMVKNLVYFVKAKDPRYALYLQNKALIDAEEEEIKAHEELDKETVSIEPDNPSHEIQLYDETAELEREACLKCWNWANMHLATLVQLDPKDVDWAGILFGTLKKIAGSKDDVQYPAIENGEYESKIKEKEQAQEKMIIEDEGHIKHNEDQEL